MSAKRGAGSAKRTDVTVPFHEQLPNITTERIKELYLIVMCFLLLFYSGMAAVRKFRADLIVVTSIAYLVDILWRATVIPFHNGIGAMLLGTVLYLAEILGLLSFYNFQYLFLKKYRLEKKTLAEFGNRELPFVDVPICTYNEPLPLLEMTIAAAANMDYPEDRYLVHVCDDKRREELRVLCQQYGISYITRENSEGAKAGNINHAVTHIHGELMAVLHVGTNVVFRRSTVLEIGGYPVRRQLPCAAVSPDDAGEHEKDHGNFLQKYGSLLQGGKVPGLLCRAYISGDGADPAHSFFRYSAGLSPTSFLNFLWK